MTRTECRHGHAWTEENTYFNPGSPKVKHCRKCRAKQQRDYRDRLKSASLERYGGCCACCGEDNPKFLSIDHVNDDGAEQRRQDPGAFQIHQWLKSNDYPDDVQVLCFNCNHGRYINGGVCPHKEVRS